MIVLYGHIQREIRLLKVMCQGPNMMNLIVIQPDYIFLPVKIRWIFLFQNISIV